MTYDGGSNILRGKADQPFNEGPVVAHQSLNEGPIVAHQSLNEGPLVAHQSLNEGPVADQLSQHDTYSETRVQTTHLLRLMRRPLNSECTCDT